MKRPPRPLAAGAPPVEMTVAASLRSSAWAILDQALLSGSGFLLAALAARWLPDAEFGAFSVAFAVYMVVFFAHYALLVEPMLVLAARRHAGEREQYDRALLVFHAAFGLAGATFLLGCAVAAAAGSGPPALAHAFGAAALAAPFATLAQLARRMRYARGQPAAAALGSALLLGLTAAGLFLIRHLGLVTAPAVYAVFGVSSLLACRAWIDRRSLRGTVSPGLVRSVVAQHWHQARFGLWTSLLQWVPMNAPYLMFPLLVADGLGLAGRLRALVTLAQPALQVNGALFALLLPALSAGAGRWTRGSRHHALAIAANSVAWCLAFPLVGEPLARLLLGERYGSLPLAWLAPLGLIPVAMGAATVCRAACLARGKVAAPMAASVVASAIVVGAGSVLIVLWSVAGALWAIVAALGAQALVLAAAARRDSHAAP